MTSRKTETAPQRMQVLEPLFTPAMQDVTAAMCRWTSGQVRLALDELREVNIFEASTLVLGGDDQPQTIVALDIEQAGTMFSMVGGQMLLAFDESHGRRFAAAILGLPTPLDGPWSELEKSVLMETGNILGCAYMNALARQLNIELIPSPPCFIQDYAAAVLQQIVQKLAMTADRLLVCRTSFQQSGKELQWQVLFIPNDALRQIMESLCHTVP